MRTRLSDEERLERRRASRKRWNERNPDKVRAGHREPFKRWAAKNQDKMRAYRAKYREKNREELRRKERERYAARMANMAKVAEAFPAFGEMRTRELMKIDVYAAARRALPRGLPEFVRDDVITEIVLAHLEGSLTLSEVPARASEFLRAYRRDFDQLKTVSLDAPIPGTDMRYIDRLAAPATEAHA